MAEFDLAILGAGCAGLSLAARLADTAPGLRTVLVDPRTGFQDDRTWCFWSDGTASLDRLVSARWPSWRFSDAAGASHTHACDGVDYVMVRGVDFYADALERVQAGAIELRLNTRAGRLIETHSRVEVCVEGGAAITARHVIDTRPVRSQPALMHQVFHGLEIETDHDAFEPACAGLMEALSGHGDTVSFLYTLPLTRRRALVEWTVFTRRATAPRALRPVLLNGLRTRGLEHFTILREEAGVLPMGASRPPHSQSARIVRAGASGGAVRASTGYAFQRIQRWADACADRMGRGLEPVGHPPEPVLRAAMDQVFLTALHRDPAAGAGFFMALARQVPPAALVRFMSDAATPLDLLHVITALPPRPFLTALPAAASNRPAPRLEERLA